MLRTAWGWFFIKYPIYKNGNLRETEKHRLFYASFYCMENLRRRSSLARDYVKNCTEKRTDYFSSLNQSNRWLVVSSFVDLWCSRCRCQLNSLLTLPTTVITANFLGSRSVLDTKHVTSFPFINFEKQAEFSKIKQTASNWSTKFSFSFQTKY